MQAAAKRLEKFFFAFLVINPFLDVVSGIFIKVMEVLTDQKTDQFNMPVTPSLLIRMAVLVLFAFYVLIILDKKSILTMLPIGVAWGLSVAGEFLFFYSFDLMSDMQYIVRFAYNVAVLLVYWRVFERSGLDRHSLLRRLNAIIVFTIALLSVAIIIPYLFGAGYTTYADRFGYRGSRGFFYSGNDITAVLMLLTPIAVSVFLRLERGASRLHYCYYAAAPALSVTALCLIGTKTSFLAVGATVGVMALYAVIHTIQKRDKVYLIRMGIILAAWAVVLTLLILFGSSNVLQDISASFGITSEVIDREGAATAFLSGRQDKLVRTWTLFKDGGIFCWLFGVGRGTQQFVIEMDIFEVFFYYGIVGTAALLWLYIKLGVSFLANLFRRFDATGLACAVALALGAGYLLIAGHVLFSVTSGFYFAFVLLYARLYYSPSARNLALV